MDLGLPLFAYLGIVLLFSKPCWSLIHIWEMKNTATDLVFLLIFHNSIISEIQHIPWNMPKCLLCSDLLRISYKLWINYWGVFTHIIIGFFNGTGVVTWSSSCYRNNKSEFVINMPPVFCLQWNLNVLRIGIVRDVRYIIHIDLFPHYSVSIFLCKPWLNL